MLLRSARVVRCDLVVAAAVAVVARLGAPCCSGEVVIAAVIPHGLFSHLRVGLLDSNVHHAFTPTHCMDAVAALHFELSADGVLAWSHIVL